MRTRFPFLVRAARTVVARPGFWVANGALTLLMLLIADDPQSIARLVLIACGLCAGAVTLRRIDDDQASGTLEQLELLPVPGWRLALETAAGATLGFAAHAVALLAVVVPLMALKSRPSWMSEPEPLLPVLAMAPAVLALLPLTATLVTLRHALRPVYRLGGLAALLMGFAYGGSALLSRGNLGDLATLACGAGLFALELAAWAMLWRLILALGGGWSARESVRGTTSCACPLAKLGTPDRWNPLTWRELKLGLPVTVMTALGGAVYIALGVSAENAWYGPLQRATTAIVFLTYWSTMVSGVRTARDRLSGLWADLAPTPVQRSAILWSRVRALSWQSALLAMAWVAFAMALPGPVRHSRVDHCCGGELLMTTVLIPLIGVSAGALAGFVAGTAGRGIIAAFGGLVVLYVAGITATVPGTMLVATLSWRGNAGFGVGLVAVLIGVAIFYGVLVAAAKRGIDRAIAEQRA